jgi:hypothetical protein
MRKERGVNFPAATQFTILLACAAVCPAQPGAETAVAAAVRSPETLARYVESHNAIDWKILRQALKLPEAEYWLAPCGGEVPASEAPCSAELATVLNPDQTIVVIRGGSFSYTVEYLRYLRDAKGGWRFAGENSAFQRNSPSHHKIIRVGNKPFLAISSDHSQNGAAVQQVLEDWFDLTLPDFEPVFSVTVEGSQWRFGFGVGRNMHAVYNMTEAGGVETVSLILDIDFNGVGLDQKAQYIGVYERHALEKKFSLRKVSSGVIRGTPMATADFEELADPFSGLSNEKLLVYALPGLQKIAAGSDSAAKDWLRSILEEAEDTPEKRVLLELLGKG